MPHSSAYCVEFRVNYLSPVKPSLISLSLFLCVILTCVPCTMWCANDQLFSLDIVMHFTLPIYRLCVPLFFTCRNFAISCPLAFIIFMSIFFCVTDIPIISVHNPFTATNKLWKITNIVFVTCMRSLALTLEYRKWQYPPPYTNYKKDGVRFHFNYAQRTIIVTIL